KNGENGFRYPAGDIDALVSNIREAIDKNDILSQNCIDMRSSVRVENTLEELESIYSELA
ncbi:MAG: glycosyltransferase family 4 protein, partial [Halobacteria archaeon]|nr:glycosyltransferase family 4 protein [Halobacteria archaeon]